MPHIIKLQQFEGPLDALLKIIEGEELDISEVSLAQVTDQYLAYIDEAELEPLEIADFLQVAAKLLLIKSRILLPFTDELEEEDGIDLAAALREYRRFVEAAEAINIAWQGKNNLYTRERDLHIQKNETKKNILPDNCTIENMQRSFNQLLKRLQPRIHLPEKTMAKIISLREKIEHFARRLESNAIFSFHDMLENRNDQSEKIVSFLAMLELVKQRQAHVEQETLFADIIVRRA